MYNIRTERSAGFAGIAFVIVTFASAIIPVAGGPLPALDMGPGQLAALLDAHRMAWLLAAWLGIPSTLFWLWFAVGIRAYLSQGVGANEGLPTYSLSAAIGSSVVGVLGGLVNAAIVYVSAKTLGDQVVLAFFTLGTLMFAALYVFLAIFTFAVSHSGRRHGTLPMWLNAIGYLSTFALLLATVGLVVPSSIFSLTGFLPIVAGMLFFLYTLILSIVVIQRVGKQETA